MKKQTAQDKTEAETWQRASKEFSDFAENLTEELKQVDPLTPEQLDELKAKAEQDPEIQETRRQTRQLELANEIFEEAERRHGRKGTKGH